MISVKPFVIFYGWMSQFWNFSVEIDLKEMYNVDTHSGIQQGHLNFGILIFNRVDTTIVIAKTIAVLILHDLLHSN